MIKGFEGIADLSREQDALHTMEELLEWLRDRKEKQFVSIRKITLEECDPWFYDEASGQIRNQRGTFFQVGAVRGVYPDGHIMEQPIIIQKEIGLLGIICRKFNGVWHFLMQAKIEPGNINYVQISPTIQATKSNFTRQHGGRVPAYLEYFTRIRSEDILADQIQSEQSSRFWGKRNRNIIIKTDADIPESVSHRWMTMSQLKELMKYENLINMDTRTVFSCIPYVFMQESLSGYSPEYLQSLRNIDRKTVVDLYLRANNYKMFEAPEVSFLPLSKLQDWRMMEDGIRHVSSYPFEVIFCGLEIEGREVTRWNQPLFAALGIATFGLICTASSGFLEILVQLKPEIGCFDAVELGPTIQEEYGSTASRDTVGTYFFEHMKDEGNIMIDIILSEEGGRFYHEQNRNVILLADKNDIVYDSDRYVWASFGTLNALAQLNNCLNIQLRNLLMLLSMHCM